MNLIDILISCVFLVAILFLCGVVIILLAEVENHGIREEFCESKGFDGQIVGTEFHEGYCYKTQGETAIKKYFFCKPSPILTSPIGKCKFLEAIE